MPHPWRSAAAGGLRPRRIVPAKRAPNPQRRGPQTTPLLLTDLSHSNGPERYPDHSPQAIPPKVAGTIARASANCLTTVLQPVPSGATPVTPPKSGGVRKDRVAPVGRFLVGKPPAARAFALDPGGRWATGCAKIAVPAERLVRTVVF